MTGSPGKKLFGLLLILTVCMAQAQRLEGVLLHEYGDPNAPLAQTHLRYHLQTADQLIPLRVSDAFATRMPVNHWLGKRVAVTLQSEPVFDGQDNPIQAIELLEGERGGGVFGAQPWVSILCKFNDVAAEPENLAFFQGMYANQPAGLDHYWREVSYNNINVVGSLAVDWINLPQGHLDYVPEPGSGTEADLNALFDDCTAVADPVVNFATGANGNEFVGINMMFNDSLDCCAWGGGRFTTLDGVSKVWRTTWNPPWAFRSEGVIAHEMGHGFGLPHANNSDGDGSPYDSPWDVMSSATGYAVNDPVYGRLGKHVNMEFKHALGWVDDAVGYIADAMSNDVLLLVNSSNPMVGNGYRFARIPLSDGTHYVVEARKEEGNYESNIPGTAVIIHHVDYGRSEPPWVIDADVPPANYADTEGVMWKTGEIFVDPIDGFTVEILNLFANGYNIRIQAQNDLIFKDGFD